MEFNVVEKFGDTPRNVIRTLNFLILSCSEEIAGCVRMWGHNFVTRELLISTRLSG